jgi:hypothetical protein
MQDDAKRTGLGLEDIARLIRLGGIRIFAVECPGISGKLGENITHGVVFAHEILNAVLHGATSLACAGGEPRSLRQSPVPVRDMPPPNLHAVFAPAAFLCQFHHQGGGGGRVVLDRVAVTGQVAGHHFDAHLEDGVEVVLHR